MMSAPSSRFACVVSAPFTRSAKKPTVPTLPTASTSAATSTRNSPARQSRRSRRSASRSVFMRSGRDATRRRTSRPADSESLRAAARRERRVVRDQHERGAVLAIETEHEIGDLDARRAVEVARRLVGHQQLRIARERARDRDALLLAARQLPRIMRGALGEADAVEPDARARLRIGARRRARAAASRSRARSARAAAGTTGTRSRAGAGAAPRARPRRVSTAPRRRCGPRRRSGDRDPPADRAASSCPSPRHRRWRCWRRARRRTKRRRGWSMDRRRS